MRINSFRNTPFRQKVLDLFRGSEVALTHKEIETQLENFDRITLFRTLKLFIENGILHEITLPNEKRYALCKEKCDEEGHNHEHLHFHCSKCDHTFCINTNIATVKLDGFNVQSAELNVFGLCKNCN